MCITFACQVMAAKTTTDGQFGALSHQGQPAAKKHCHIFRLQLTHKYKPASCKGFQSSDLFDTCMTYLVGFLWEIIETTTARAK